MSSSASPGLGPVTFRPFPANPGFPSTRGNRPVGDGGPWTDATVSHDSARKPQGLPNTCLQDSPQPGSPARLRTMRPGGAAGRGAARVHRPFSRALFRAEKPLHPPSPAFPRMNAHPVDPTTPAAEPSSTVSAGTVVYHRPVLVEETTRMLAPGPGRVFVDGTLGGGGHTAALLAAGAEVIGLDRDAEALAHVRQRLETEVADGRLRLRQADFRDFPRVLDGLGVAQVDGLLLDLGVSSRQLDAAGRGFSFQADGPLDMRMDQTAGDAAGGRTAADLVNTLPAGELAHLFRTLGEEPAAGPAATAIVRARAAGPLLTTLALAGVIERALPRRGPRHPATRVFQALRMAVNDELGALAAALEAVPGRLRPGGRLAVIAFHSLEDRSVKNFLRETSQPTLDRPEWPAPRPNSRHFFRLPQRRPVEASAEELAVNPRARSAKLRVAERVVPKNTTFSRDSTNAPDPR